MNGRAEEVIFYFLVVSLFVRLSLHMSCAHVPQAHGSQTSSCGVSPRLKPDVFGLVVASYVMLYHLYEPAVGWQSGHYANRMELFCFGWIDY